MFLSKILKRCNQEQQYKIFEEQSFDTLALIAQKADMKTCTFLDNQKYLNDISEEVSMVISIPELCEELIKKGKGVCVVEQPRILFFELHNYLSSDSEYIRKQEATKIGTQCNISSLACVAPNNVVIGNGVTIEEFAVIRENTVIGDNTVIRAGAKIGGEGFEFKRSNGKIKAVRHLGGVEIGENVEIQYNTAIDKAVYPWDNTVVGDYTKIDNLVHIGHAVKLGKDVMVVAQSGIGGRTVIGDGTWIGFGSTIINGISIGKNARANIGSVVTRDIPDNGSVTGNFAIDHSKFIENLKSSTS